MRLIHFLAKSACSGNNRVINQSLGNSYSVLAGINAENYRRTVLISGILRREE